MKPLVQRLRETAARQRADRYPVSAGMLDEAADEIERLRKAPALLASFVDAYAPDIFLPVPENERAKGAHAADVLREMIPRLASRLGAELLEDAP